MITGVAIMGVGCSVARLLGVTGVTTTTNLVGVGRPGEIRAVASPRAEKSAPTADQARLPSSRMPTMPTMVAISRAGLPSSGRAGRSTSHLP